jgi:hypothetical protein
MANNRANSPENTAQSQPLATAALDDYADQPQIRSEPMPSDRKPDPLQSLSPEEYAQLPAPSREAMRAAMERGRKARDAAVVANRRVPLGLDVMSRSRYRSGR